MKQVVFLKRRVPNQKYTHEEIQEAFPRLIFVSELENGNVMCALNGHMDKQVEVEAEDIAIMKPILLVKDQEGTIHEVAGFYNYEGEIRLHTLEKLNVLGGKFDSWGYADAVATRMFLAREAGALYCEVPTVELEHPYLSISVKHLINEQFDEDIAMRMHNWKVVAHHDWVWRMQITESMDLSNNRMRRFQVRNVHGWGSLLTYEGNVEDFEKDLFIAKAKEIRDKIDNRDQSLFLIQSEENYSVHSRKLNPFVEMKLSA